MNMRLRSFFVVTALLPLASCEKFVLPPTTSVPQQAAPDLKTQTELANARDALQRQALEIETRSALMEKQLAEMQQAMKDRENSELRGSLEALKQQNNELRAQADAARRQSNVITQRIVTTPQMNVAPQAALPRDYSLFYQRLAPYGRWMDVNGYGYCWCPMNTAPNWRPYVDGCWVWSALGWTWQSNEPFGWATYHYGRWMNLSRYGWIWVPGSDWAPAWVAWRQSRECVGWAPLPPERGSFSGAYRDCDSHYHLGPSSYTFITTNQFVRPSYTNVCAPVTQNTTIFQQSVNITQIVPGSGHGHEPAFMHQGGPPRAQMEQASGAPVPQAQIPSATAGQLPPQHSHESQGAMPQLAIVELPAVKADAPPVAPQIVERIEQPKVVDAFAGVPHHTAAKIRETMAEEKASAVVQQPVVIAPPLEVAFKPEAPVVVNVPAPETVRPAIAVMPAATPTVPVAAAEQTPAALPTVAPVTVTLPETQVVATSAPASPPAVITTTPEKIAPEPTVTAVVPVAEPDKIPPSPVNAASESMPRPQVDPIAAAPPPSAEKMAAEQAVAAAAETARMQTAAAQQQEQLQTQQRIAAEQAAAQAAAMQQRQEQEAQDRAVAEKMTAEQAAAAQQQEQLQTQQRIAAEQAAAEAERVRQQAAMQQQEQIAAQQRAVAERLAAEQAAAEAERVRQAEAAAMQRQQEAATRRAAEEQQMRAQQEAAQRAAQELAQRQAEEQARQAAEAQLRAQQEAAQRAAQEMAQRQAEEAARRAQEEAQRAAAEAAQRAAAEAARNQPPPAPPGS